MATTGTKLQISHTVNTSGAIVGQGTEPELVVRYSTDDASVSTPTWLDATPKVRSFSVSRGRDNELSEMDAGTATLALDNRTRTFDPVSNASIRPMNRWWIREQFTGETQDIFKGYAESYDQTWPGGGGSGDAVAIVNAVDEFKVLALDGLPVTNPPRDNYENLVMFDNPSGYWRMRDSSLNAVVGPALTTRAGGDFNISNLSPIIGDELGLISGALSVISEEVGTETSDGGDVGDVAGLSEIGIEMWFRPNDSTPTANMFLANGPLLSVGHQWTLKLNTDGTVSFALGTGAAMTTITTTVTLEGIVPGVPGPPENLWWHLFGTVSGGNLRLYINGIERATGAWTSTIGAVPSGLLPAIFFSLGDASETAAGGLFTEVALYRYGVAASRVSAHYEAGVLRGFPRLQLPGARVNAVLDAASNHAPRFIQAGTNMMSARFMHGQPPLNELNAAQRAESVDALLFIARDGTVTYLADGHRSTSPWNTVQATFDDDGTDLPYYDLDLDFSEAFLFNEWNVTPDIGTVATASDATSISKYLKRSRSITDLTITSQTDASAIASAMLAKYKDPLTRITQITLVTKEPAVSEAVFRRDIGDRIRIFRTPPGGGARIDQTAFIQGIKVTADAHSGVWKIVWNVSPV